MANNKDGIAVVDADIVEDGQVAFAPSAIEALVRGEIDVQIATAKRYPRSLEAFHRRAISMATIDEETAESCLYRRPVGKKNGKNEYAEGMSVRMAEIVGACYGNLRVYATLIEQPAEYVRTRGMAIDLETNFASSSEVIESTLKQDGSPYSARMRVVVAKAALSKARRDATFQVVPKALAKPIETAARQVLLGTAETLEKRRHKVAAWISKLGIEERRVYSALGIEGPADLTAEKLELLTGLRTAIKDNETTIDEAFPESGGLPQPAQRKSQQAPAVASDPMRPGDAQPAATQPPTGVAPSQSGDSGQAPSATIGLIVAISDRPGGALVKLDTGYQAATKDDAILRGAKMAKDAGLRVELVTRPARDPRFAPIITDVKPVGGAA